MIDHIVVIWLKPDTTKAIADTIFSEAKDLANIDGVVGLRVGEPLPTDRPVVDTSYTFALSMRFETRETMETYLKCDAHQSFLADHLRPALKRVIVYDF